MTWTRPVLPAAALALSACAAAGPPAAQFRNYDLDLSHPAPNATYLMVAPGALDADLPKPRQIKSRGFSRYLREATGCVIDPGYPATAIGDPKVPAAYMVPVVCP